MSGETTPGEPSGVKSCCAAVYQSDFARLLLGDSFHPGGLWLTVRLGQLLELQPGVRVMDVASGRGESAISLAMRFGCEVVGIDFGTQNVAEATSQAEQAGVSQLVSFFEGDAERIAFPNASFDAVVCECAFCTFSDKRAAASEFARILRPGGRVGLSDLTRSAMLPPELSGSLAWISCIADAKPVEDYVDYLREAGMSRVDVEPHDETLGEMVREIQGKLLSAELMSKLNKLELAGVDLAQAKTLARAAAEAVRAKTLGYTLIVGWRKP